MLFGPPAAACRIIGRRQQRFQHRPLRVSEEDGYTVQRCPRAAWGGHDEHCGISADDIGGILGGPVDLLLSV